MTERVLSTRELNRALLARQLLLERAPVSVADALEQIGGIQNQYAPSGYIGLWTRTEEFQRDALTESLERRTAVQGTLMRVTIHLVSAREYPLFAAGVRRARREWFMRVQKSEEAPLLEAAARLREALADGPRRASELGELQRDGGLWVDLVRIPPSGTWERRRADLVELAERWLGPAGVSEGRGLEHLVTSYLRAFGPAAAKDVSSWAGVPAGPLAAAAERLELGSFRDEAGRRLYDLPDAPLPAAETPAPVRLLPHWDANLLVHARRAGVLPEEHRPRVFSTKNPFSVGTILVDGVVVGAWRLREGRVELEAYERVPRAAWSEVEEEAARLERFVA